jgi:hypothetical protein
MVQLGLMRKNSMHIRFSRSKPERGIIGLLDSSWICFRFKKMLVAGLCSGTRREEWFEE